MYSLLKQPPTIPANSGSKIEPEYMVQISKEGKKELVKVGETNVYDLIQECLEETKIENIIRKVTEGDTSALEQIQGTYMDLTEMPRSFMDMQNMIIKANREFEKLPVEVRRKFDMSPEQYINEMGTEKFMEKLGYTKEITEPTVEKEPVVEKEVK